MAGDEARSRAADGDETARILGAEIRILPFGILHGANCEFNSGLFLRQSGKRGLEAAGFRSGNSRALEHSLSSCAAVAERLQAYQKECFHSTAALLESAFKMTLKPASCGVYGKQNATRPCRHTVLSWAPTCQKPHLSSARALQRHSEATAAILSMS
ncbi:hypothetical protein MG293_012022 [Ovis ammon polii]|uniref:Uncharacterized protein n=1 Tax=Ovis ammon polii TaxID=230172 RepID=A0AAD4U614_OVIAM|nr:hypothetical protein MG293_012022 [Ovis ammon polii]